LTMAYRNEFIKKTERNVMDTSRYTDDVSVYP